MCNMDCLNCSKKDCDNDTITAAERAAQNDYDTEITGSRKYGRAAVIWKYRHSEKGKAVQRKYVQSEKGKERRKRYFESEKGKAARERYNNSELGKATRKRADKKKIESGKNAEYCRAYYYRKKAEREGQG